MVIVSASTEARRIAHGCGLPLLGKPFEPDVVLRAIDTAIESGAIPRFRA